MQIVEDHEIKLWWWRRICVSFFRLVFIDMSHITFFNKPCYLSQLVGYKCYSFTLLSTKRNFINCIHDGGLAIRDHVRQSEYPRTKSSLVSFICSLHNLRSYVTHIESFTWFKCIIVSPRVGLVIIWKLITPIPKVIGTWFDSYQLQLRTFIGKKMSHLPKKNVNSRLEILL